MFFIGKIQKIMKQDVILYRPSFIKSLGLEAVKERKCLMCPRILPKSVKYYCSGSCIQEAKSRGTYGNEEKV